MTPAVFANLVGNPERVVQFVVNLLAVGGAFLLGQALTGVIVWLIDRRLTGGKSPPGAKRAARLIGGCVFAVLAALILFGHGEGWTIMGGGGTGDTNGKPTPATGPGGSDAPPTPATEPRPPTTRPSAPVADRVRVTLLGGGDVKDGRFYCFDGDPKEKAKTLAEATNTLTRRKETANGLLGLDVQFAPNNVLSAKHAAVIQLTDWATAHGLPVTLPASE